VFHPGLSLAEKSQAEILLKDPGHVSWAAVVVTKARECRNLNILTKAEDFEEMRSLLIVGES
jgi:hypothetical protein